MYIYIPHTGLPWWLRQSRVCLQCRRPRFDPWFWRIPWRRKRQPTPVLLPWKSHKQRSLEGYSPWSRKESDTTEQLTHTHTHLIIQSYMNCLEFENKRERKQENQWLNAGRITANKCEFRKREQRK